MDTLSMFSTFAVILSLLIITTILHGFCSQDMLSDTTLPLLAALRWQEQDLVAQKVEQTIKINAAAIVCPQPIQLAVNPLKI